MRKSLVLLLVVALVGCSKSSKYPGSDDGGSPSTGDRKPAAKDGEPKPKKDAGTPPAGPTAKVGEVEAELCDARVVEIWGRSFGTQSLLGKGTQLQVRVSNRSPSKITRFAGWQDTAKLTDEHGNEYKPVKFPAGWSFNFPAFERIADEPIHPEKMLTTYLFFEPVTAGSSQVTLIVPAAAVGGRGDLRLKIPVGKGSLPGHVPSLQPRLPRPPGI